MITEWINTQRIVLAYIFFKGRDTSFVKAMQRVDRDFFNPPRKGIWDVFCLYHKQTATLPDIDMFRKFLRSKNVSEENILLVENEIFSVEQQVLRLDEGGFLWHLGRLDELFKRIKFEEFSQKAITVMDTEGFARGRDGFLTEIAKLDSTIADLSPDGLMQDEIDSFILDVASARDNRATMSVDFGIETLDREVLGLRGGEVVLIIGWTGVGKTTLMVNMAVNVAFVQMKNVVFVTTETIRNQVIRRVVSRMSKLPMFDTPVPSKKFKGGNLSEEERNTLVKIQNHLKCGKHGNLMITQAPSNATMEWLRAKLIQYESQFKVDLLILDDVRNMLPRVARRQEYEEVGQLIRDFKRLARTHANRGIPVVSPYHINRDTFKMLSDRDGSQKISLTIAGLASSSEAERSTDLGLFLWNSEDNPGSLEMTVLKMRDGKSGQKIVLSADLDYQYLAEAGGTTDSLLRGI